jgi:hypothetical protein
LKTVAIRGHASIIASRGEQQLPARTPGVPHGVRIDVGNPPGRSTGGILGLGGKRRLPGCPGGLARWQTSPKGTSQGRSAALALMPGGPRRSQRAITRLIHYAVSPIDAWLASARWVPLQFLVRPDF